MLSPERLQARYEGIGIANEFHQVHLDDDWSYGEFDVVWCAEVIEHLLDDRKLLRKLRSQLHPRGILIITTPSKAFIEGMARLVPGCEAISTVQDGGHVRTGYDLEMLRALAASTSLPAMRREPERTSARACCPSCQLSSLRMARFAGKARSGTPRK